ncbi:MAG TPA: SUMF1/EgtB/PvdO family nonheme iron enzyme [Candidatus Hydrogenedentes bacterium]|nr:SUMF1/EgtB/PvdO family nonheme iron enzyme [Candidatus Hydrogenedentota bacterium]
MRRQLWFTAVATCWALVAPYAEEAMADEFTNSIGMRLVSIPAGTFPMGQSDGDWDERPVHEVTLSKPFYLATTEVTNAQYERFDPDHRRYRGHNGFSTRDDEAVVYVSWDDAVAFCAWLSKEEGKPYRLPTEAEWEYACRAGTQTPFNTGDTLPLEHHRHQKREWIHEPASLRVGITPPNAFGLHEMHGNVEEWCLDWYGPYDAVPQTDPVGRVEGLARVTRGGSHNTDLPFLRSANRLGAMPDDKHDLIGFRVAMADAPSTRPLPAVEPPLCMRDVAQEPAAWTPTDAPIFDGPTPFVLRPDNVADIPMFKHNHCPSIAWCANGDLLAVWFSTEEEAGREMVILGSRLRRGRAEWEPPSLFFKIPDRNMTGSALFNDGSGRILFMNGVEAAGTWEKLAMVLRSSADNGATWSTPRFANAFHQRRNQVIHGMMRTREGYLVQLCDAVHTGSGGTAMHISRDNGETWEEATNYGYGAFAVDGGIGGWIAGIHASVVQLEDGALMAFGRGDDIDGRMPMSVSRDMGRTWTYSASPFPPIGGGQRLVLMRLREGPILFCSYTDTSKDRKEPKGMTVTDAAGNERRIYGLFAAVSLDDGATWPIRKLISPGAERRELDGGAWTQQFELDATHAEPMGYLAATQSPDNVIHLISSALYYRFNLAWINEPMPAE